MTTFIVLLRGVNVGGHNRVPMAELRDACADAGFGDVRTYINSGNVVFQGPGTATQAARKVETLLAKSFQVEVPVIVRTAADWARYVAGPAFPDAAPKALHLGFAGRKPQAGCVQALQERATAGERVQVVGDALWIDFKLGVGRSKLTPAAIDKAVGAPTTLRNWTTIQALHELASPT